MSTLAPPRPPQPASPDVAAPATGAPERDSTPARLAAFAALAGFGVLHWATLVDDSPTGRMLLVVLVATAAATALALLARVRGRVPRPALYALAAAVGIAALVLGLLAAGLEARLLLPKHWGELGDGLDRGLGGIQGVDWPYDGTDAWIRQTILLGAPLLLAIAATVAFWPAHPRGAPILRTAGLIVLLLLYGSAVTEHDPGEPLLRGIVLLVLVAAWLWLPRVPVREAALGAGLVASVGVLALPLAAALDGGRPWWDYRGWNLFGGGKVVTFRWTHQYGPLDWPRDGTTLMNVKSEQALYWKAESLDSFDGVRWSRSNASDATDALQGLPSARQAEGPTWEPFEWNPRWDRELRFTVRALSSDLVVGAGTPYRVEGVGSPASSGSDGTIRLVGDRLEEGDSYTVNAYVPKPSAKQMRASPDGLPAVLLPFTTIELTEPSDSGPAPEKEVKIPLWGDGAVGDTAFGDPEAPTRALSASAYSRMYGVAVDVTAGAPTMYDAVKRIEDYLNREFSYSEKPRPARYPLNAFMFRDGFGYCQQFSGAMALMLRMVGIPARVAAGFAPGSFNRDTEEFRVRDLDAHSWVEVYFNGIGWVTFDPTPAAAPAELQEADRAGTSASPLNVRGDVTGQVRPDNVSGGAGSAAGGEDGGLSVPFALLLALLVGGSLASAPALLRRRRLRLLAPDELAEAQLSELRRALERLGWELPASTTLLGLERRLGRLAGPASEAYAGGLRANRYDPRAPAAPSLAARRALRRELSRGSLAERLRGLRAFPPAGPRV